jgi:hypothetical protein
MRELHVFADDDASGRAASERIEKYHRLLGRRVVLRLPPVEFEDWGAIAIAMRQERTGA